MLFTIYSCFSSCRQTATPTRMRLLSRNILGNQVFMYLFTVKRNIFYPDKSLSQSFNGLESFAFPFMPFMILYIKTHCANFSNIFGLAGNNFLKFSQKRLKLLRNTIPLEKPSKTRCFHFLTFPWQRTSFSTFSNGHPLKIAISLHQQT